MASHNDLGKLGEALASEWLLQNGYEILHRNWRHAHYEVDIIVAKANTLHFIEVKARRGTGFGYPEESVDNKKIENLMHAADAFQQQFPQWKRIQYDILSIIIKPGGKEDYFFIEDIYL